MKKRTSKLILGIASLTWITRIIKSRSHWLSPHTYKWILVPKPLHDTFSQPGNGFLILLVIYIFLCQFVPANAQNLSTDKQMLSSPFNKVSFHLLHFIQSTNPWRLSSSWSRSIQWKEKRILRPPDQILSENSSSAQKQNTLCALASQLIDLLAKQVKIRGLNHPTYFTQSHWFIIYFTIVLLFKESFPVWSNRPQQKISNFKNNLP